MVINQEVSDVGQVEEMGNAYKTLVGMSGVKEPFTGRNCKLEDNLKMELRKNLMK
jgi:hypothetical protein